MSVWVWLDARELEKIGACADGIAEVRRLAAEQGRKHKARLDWSPAGAAALWARYPRHLAWLAVRSLIPPTATAGNEGTATAGNEGTATAGDFGTATAGHGGTATAGNEGTATAGYSGTATAGYNGTATAGHGGTATAGQYGTATAGHGGTATAGQCGSIRVRWHDGTRYRWACADVGDPGIDPDVAYVVRDGKMVRK